MLSDMRSFFTPRAAPMSTRTFRCRDDQWERAELIAKLAGVSTSEVVREAVERFLAEVWNEDVDVPVWRHAEG